MLAGYAPADGALVNKVWILTKRTFAEWQKDKVSRLAAALAYYTIFSLAPLLIITIAVIGLFYGAEAAQGRIVGQVEGLVGHEGASIIQTMIENAAIKDRGVWATIIGIALLVYGASGVFGQLQDALNTIWEVKPKPGRGIWGTIKTRFLSFAMVMVIAFLLLVSLVISAAISALTDRMTGGGSFLGPAIDFIVSLGVITVLIAMLLHTLPDVKLRWRDVWLGSAITAVLFTLGKIGIGLYLGRSSVTSVYGAAGSLVVLLIWVYYSAQILLIGAEFTQVQASFHGKRRVPEEYADSLTEHERVAEGIPHEELQSHG
jgi:membrane protein